MIQTVFAMIVVRMLFRLVVGIVELVAMLLLAVLTVAAWVARGLIRWKVRGIESR